MKVVFVSNYYNHHQAPFSEAMYKLTNGNYTFIATEPMEEERLNMGWGISDFPNFVKFQYLSSDSKKNCQSLIDNADVVIIGSPYNKFIRKRLRKGLLTFRYSERILKHYNLITFIAKTLRQLLFSSFRRNLYMLCASAYASSDYYRMFSFRKKCFKWGYFPKKVFYSDVDGLMKSKQPKSILWVARFIKWKHPEIPIQVIKKLKEEGYEVRLEMIGNGPLLESYERFVKENNLQNIISFSGSMNPSDVRKRMEKSEIFLFTSDRNEGWGAVLNEAMNSGCAVVASHAIGSVPFLIQNGKNGLIYKDGDFRDLYLKVKSLLDNQKMRIKIAENAYDTIVNVWNADNVAQRFMDLVHSLQQGEQTPFIDGPCSVSEVISDY